MYDLVKRKVEGGGGEFKSVEDYVKFVLRELLKEEEEEGEKQAFTPKEEEKLKKIKKFRLPVNRFLSISFFIFSSVS